MEQQEDTDLATVGQLRDLEKMVEDLKKRVRKLELEAELGVAGDLL